jgi:hypothetical protein
MLRANEEIAMNLFEQHMIETTGKHPGLDLDPHLHKKLRLKASDVSAEYAQRHISKFDHLLGFMLAAFQKREDGGHANLKQAKRIEQMCLLHPDFHEKAKEMLADPVHANAGVRK